MTDGTLIANGNTMISSSPDFWLMGLTFDPATSTLFSLACYSQTVVSLFRLNSTDGKWYWLSKQNSWKANACYSPNKPSGLFSFTVGDSLRLGFTWRDQSKGDSVYIVDGTTGELIKTLPPSTTCPYVTTLAQY